VYGTTNGPFTMAKKDKFLDIFVLRLHQHDGSYNSHPPVKARSSHG
jgi:hypothetical protein